MSPEFPVLAGITGAFIVLLIAKSILKWKFCVICVSVGLTWLALLTLYWLKVFDHPAVIGVLMGQSVAGVYYLLERRTEQRLHIFRLPVLLTLTVLALFALGVSANIVPSLLLLASLWLALSVMYLYRNNQKTKLVVERIIACCRDW